MDKIKQIADQADMIINGYAFTREENRRLSKLRDTLLPKLMSGELDVSDIDF